MKSHIKLFLFASIVYIVNLQDIDKESSVMNFFKGLFVNDKKKNNKAKEKFAFKERERVSGDEAPATVLSDWLRVSTPLFKSAHLFPPILLHNGSFVNIKTDDYYFRINHVLPVKPNNDDPAKPANNTYFWFRLSESHLYYSTSDSDVNVLGAIDVKSINTTKESDDQYYPCFDVLDVMNNNWKICASDTKIMRKWVCAIKKAINE